MDVFPQCLHGILVCRQQFGCEGGNGGLEVVMCFTVNHCCVSNNCDGVNGLICLLIKGTFRGINSTGRRQMSALLGLVLVRKKGLKLDQVFPDDDFKFQFWKELVKYYVKKIRSQAVVATYLGVQGGPYGVGEVDGCFTMVDDCFKRLLYVLRGGHAEFSFGAVEVNLQ